MAIAIRAKRGLTRRHLLVRSASIVALTGIGGLAGPYLSRAADRPQIACGLASAAMFQKGCTAQQGENLAPCFGLQFFGRVDIDGRSGIMTVTLKDVDDRALWSVDIEPRPDARPGRILAHHI
jgi:phosphodiesterase/alkaline phosphatase D-like protein